MSRVFVDTSALVALFDRKDAHHPKAKTILERMKKERVKLLISDYVFDESITTVLSAAGHETAVSVGDFMMGSKLIEIVRLDEAVQLKAWDYFKKRPDKLFSFTDCTSFVLMKELHIHRYFSFDGDFRQAGFVEYD